MINLESVAQPFLLHSRFQDFDEFADTVREWDVDFIQLERGMFQPELTQIGVDTSLFTHLRLNRLVHQRGSSPRGLRTLGVLADPSFRALWRGHEIIGDVIMAFPPGAEFDGVSNANFDVFTLSFSEEVLAETGRALGIPAVQDLLGNTEVLTCHPHGMRELRRTLHCFQRALTKLPPQERDHRLLGQLQDEIPRKLLSSLSAPLSSSEETGSRLRDRALNRALACIEEYEDTPLTVQALSRLSGASERTLQYAFLERFSVSPKTYLQSLRFNRVRRELRNADPRSTRVIDIANQWDFWHMGQFAADYRRLFGELPSKTLGE